MPNRPVLRSAEDLAAWVAEAGFLPFFRCGIPGFSIEEHTPPELWFSATEEGPWEWKGPVTRAGTCVYGKFFRNKAGFVSLDWLPDFANLRRDGYDFDARCDEGLVPYPDREVYGAVAAHGSLLTPALKRLCGYGGKEGKKGFDAVITRLQMQTYVCVADFEYALDKYGRPYGWGVARYTTPEALFGYDRVAAAYARSPEESRQRVLARLRELCPNAGERQLAKIG